MANGSPMLSSPAGEDGTVIKLGKVVMILDLHRKPVRPGHLGHLGIDRETVRKHIASGLGAPVYGPRRPGSGASIP
jgi:hypothetical protein